MYNFYWRNEDAEDELIATLDLKNRKWTGKDVTRAKTLFEGVTFAGKPVDLYEDISGISLFLNNARYYMKKRVKEEVDG